MIQADTNRANAQHSTGPKSDAGKHRSSLNALRHGLTGQIVVMPNEDLRAYQSHLASFTAEYRPQGPTESHLVQSLADTSWRLNRAAALESNVLSLPAAPHDDPIQAALAIAAALESQAKALSNLSLHTQRLSRQFERTLTQLRDLQRTRQAKEKQDLEDLLDIVEMYDSKSEPYDPATDGFVFTKPQIATAQRLRHRKSLAQQAFSYAQSA